MKHNRFILLSIVGVFVLMLAWAGLATAAPSDPHEPNDSLATATPLVLEFDVLEAYLAYENDVDYYQFATLSGISIRANIYVDDQDMKVAYALLDSDGSVLASDDLCGSGSNSGELSYVMAQADTYYLRVTGCPGTVNPNTYYSVFIEATRRYEVEPNDTRRDAQELGVDRTSLNGTLEAGADRDFFRFPGQANTALSVHVAAETYYGSTLHPRVAVLDNKGTILASSAGCPGYNSPDDACVNLVLPKTGDYFVRVIGDAGEGEYSLSLSDGYYNEQEPNDLPGQALLVGYNSALSGTVGPGDVDFYKFKASAGDKVKLIDPEWCLVDDPYAWDAEWLVLDANQNPLPHDAGIYTIPKNGTYFVKVLAGNEYFGDYDLELSLRTGDEPNDSPAMATPLTPGVPIYSAIDPDGEYDYYKFSGEAGAVFTADISAGNVSGGFDYPTLALIAGDGSILAKSGDWDNWPYLDETLPYSGVYFLEVTSTHSCHYYGGMGGPYRLMTTLGGGESSSEAVTLTPTNDTFLNLKRAKGNFGAKRILKVRDASADFHTYIKFNAAGIEGTVQSATLRLYVTDIGPDGGQVYRVSSYYDGTTDLWLEKQLTPRNAPPISGSPVANLGAVGKGWVEVDVTAATIAAMADDEGRVSFGIQNGSKNQVAFSSKEGAHPPELVIVTAP